MSEKIFRLDKEDNIISGTKSGGIKARDKNLAKNPNFYKEIGSRGGKASTTGGFATKEPCNCSIVAGEHTKPQCAGAIGGKISRRNKEK